MPAARHREGAARRLNVSIAASAQSATQETMESRFQTKAKGWLKICAGGKNFLDEFSFAIFTVAIKL
jgi:hypothetical protein